MNGTPGETRSAIAVLGAADKPKVSLGAASEGGGHGFSVSFDFSFEFGETRVGRIAAYLRQRWVLEISLPVVGVVVRHVVCGGVHGVVRYDKSISSVTMVQTKRSH